MILFRKTLSLMLLTSAWGCAPPVSQTPPTSGNDQTDAGANTTDAGQDAADAATEPADAGWCAVGATQCSGLQVQVCADQAGHGVFGAPADCDLGAICRDSVGCVPLTDTESSHVDALFALLTESRIRAAQPVAVDYGELETNLWNEMLLGDGTPKAYVQTMWHALLALPQGHQMLSPTMAATYPDLAEAEALGFMMGALTRYSACLRPYQDHAVVTIGSAMSHLSTGDEVVAINHLRGAELTRLLLDAPNLGDVVVPTEAGRLALAVRAFLSIDRQGTVLTVRHGGAGDEIDVELPAGSPLADAYSCGDAFGRDDSVPAGSILSDGTGLLYVPAFDQPSAAAFEALVGPEFDKVKAAPRLILDLRGNRGGRLASAIELVAELLDAPPTDYCEFFDRVPNSDPPAYASAGRRRVDAALFPSPPRFAYHGRVAILVDGGTISAAEHLVFAARLVSQVIVVGTRTAGAYGNTSQDVPRNLPGVPGLQVQVNRSQVRSIDGTVLEGTPQVPDVVVEYEPMAISHHTDPALLAAMAALSQ